jgi:hypothetical protein|tara:strand:+ start:2724 stop:3137 length:414 start_codon:yes stop_codon:yes gene_type:complete
MALTASCWSETVDDRSIFAKKKRNRITLTLDNASSGNAYPTSGGIPLPTTMGMVRNIDYIILTGYGHITTGNPTSFVRWLYAATMHSLIGYQPLYTFTTAGPGEAGSATTFKELATTWTPTVATPTPPVFYVEAVGW